MSEIDEIVNALRKVGLNAERGKRKGTVIIRRTKTADFFNFEEKIRRAGVTWKNANFYWNADKEVASGVLYGATRAKKQRVWELV